MAEWPSQLTLRPIQAWPSTLTRNRKMSQFSAPLRTTLKELTKELASIRAKNVVMQIALEETQFRLDGYPRAGTRPEHPGIILSMETSSGAISFPCDTFTTWEDNLRAIVKTMENLRAIDRYGVTKNGEQYSGWKALEAPAPDGPTTTEEALAVLAEWVIPSVIRDDLARAVRLAKREAHPDRGGEPSDFHKVTRAEEFLKSVGAL